MIKAADLITVMSENDLLQEEVFSVLDGRGVQFCVRSYRRKKYSYVKVCLEDINLSKIIVVEKSFTRMKIYF